MEIEFQKAVGKGTGEVLRDIAEFLEMPCVIHPQKQINISSLLPELNMPEQFSFALLSEARTQGWAPDAAERFYRRAVENVIEASVIESMLAAFQNPDGEQYLAYTAKYGNRFSMLDGSYWSTCLALGIDAGQISDVMVYLRLFTVCLMEFAYMGDRNPQTTYTWSYYESFRRMLDELTSEPESPPLPLKVRALGGTVGKREQDSYPLSLGLDIENPNADKMARDVELDITLKDKNGNVITVIRDQIKSIDPSAIFHYGVTKKIRGAATASFSAVARADSHLKLSVPIMKHIKMNALRVSPSDNTMQIKGTLSSGYDTSIGSFTVHYQFLSADNRILGGGNEWILDGLQSGGSYNLKTSIGVSVKNAAKAVYSIDFDAVELVK